MKREFYVYIEHDEDGFYVGEVPQLRACYAQGRTIDELIKNITEVIELCVENNIQSHTNFVGIHKVVLNEQVTHV